MKKTATGRGTAVQILRRFNRYYTNRLGLLSRYRFDTNLTLTEARVIFEVGQAGEHTQSALGRDLKVDMGYLNRVVRRLEERDLVSIRKDERDGRVSLLALTESGHTMLAKINSDSDAEVEDMLRGLNEQEALALVTHMREAQRLLEKQAGRRARIQRAESDVDIDAARTLMREYAEFLGEDLSFQGFDKELAGLPGKYSPPSGVLFIARMPAGTGGSRPAGCVALRRLSAGICEMKRMFVRPECRGLGIGRLLAERVIEEARVLGYRLMRLDTLNRLESAVGLYRSMGFKQIPPYCENPLPGVMFWEKDLKTGTSNRAE
ncbi:MAG: bifunctional helix-turn-helix transcriptional regulator/GNAT family N-acetyltransferase [Spirochaetia bacterium]|jgi:DNA-binding MarR family transcriptional regulator/ribosomal protein S18 acetylase RimI-like enzyme